MNGKALGIIETVGYVPAVEATDVAVKTADVTIIGSQALGGGLVSILMTGDVSAVKASIDAGSSAAGRLGEVRSSTVIARTAEGLDGILIEEGKRPKCFPGRKAVVAGTPESIREPQIIRDPEATSMPEESEIASEPEMVLEADATTAGEKPEAVLEPEAAPEPAPEKPAGETPEAEVEGAGAGEGEPLSVDMAELKKFKVNKLRRLARQFPAFSIPKEEIKYAKKKDLLEAFTEYIKTLDK